MRIIISRLLSLGVIILIAAGLVVGLHSAETKNGALCGSPLHWAFGHASSQGGAFDARTRASLNGECRDDARRRVLTGALLLVGAGTLGVGVFLVRRRAQADGRAERA